jgi:serine/threonine-protein kinase RsbW
MSGETDAPRIRLELTSRPEAARLVRSMSSAAGEALDFPPELLSDVNTAVTEACNNVIVHAYGDLPGPMSVDLATGRDGLELRVRDHGCGIRQAVPEPDGLKVGLALMSALADRAEFINVPEGGTEVRLSFLHRGGGDGGAVIDTSRALRRRDGSSTWQAQQRFGLSGEVVLTVSPVELLGPILGRIGRTLAPSAGFSLARCYDVYLLTDALGAHAKRAAHTTSISVALGAHNQLLEIALSPLRLGTSGRLERTAGASELDALARLTEDISVSSLENHETLRVSMRDRLRA